MIIVLGIDPGMARFGWSSVTKDGNKIELGLTGLIAHPRDDASAFNDYLNEGIAQISEQFPVLLSIVQPNLIVSETVPAGKLGSRSELVVAAITTAKTIAFQWGVEWKDIGANTVKKIVCENGNATKAQIKNAVMSEFPLLAQRHKKIKQEQREAKEKASGFPQDIFDAVAIAYAGVQIFGEADG